MRQDRKSWISVSMAWGSTMGLSVSTPRGSMRKGTASTRKPDTPSASQNPMILRISWRTAGLVVLRSGWNL
ncbi:hypothetical protein D3C87_2023600 [compost metagenome]